MKHALITGGAQGLGLALAKGLVKRGWRLTLIDRDEDQLKSAVTQLLARLEGAGEAQQATSEAHKVTSNAPEIKSESPSVQGVSLDLLDNSALSSWLDQAADYDLVVNNAGITHRSPASSTTMEVFERVMALNWRVPVRLTQGLLSGLRERKGGVIVISSMAGWLPLPGRAAYSASKSAVSQHFEVWRPELQRQGVHLLLAYPSFLHTQIEGNALGADGKPASHARSTVGKVQSAEAMAEQILTAYFKAKTRVWGSQWSSRIGYYLWALFPAIFRRLTWRKFQADIPNDY